MRAPALGEAVTHLPWVCPCAASLLAMSRAPGAAWETVRHDPGAVLLAVTRGTAGRTVPGLSFFPTVLREPGVLEEAARQLEKPGNGFVAWDQPPVQPIYRSAVHLARLAAALAESSGSCDPDNAWVAGLLAPLGWLAVAVVDPGRALACLEDPEARIDPVGTQEHLWGLDQSAIARRLNRRWGLPRWLGAVTGHLDLPVATAQMLGADPALFRIVQLAVGLAQRHDGFIPLLQEVAPDAHAEALGLTDRELAEAQAGAMGQPLPALVWQAPTGMPLLREVLLLAAENRRLAETPVHQDAESDVDRLHRALHDQQTTETHRLQGMKLVALAELAAGAGHEINNPLAVISGQAQYLLHHEADANRQKSLQTIVSQTQRIHDLLTDLMHYARPPKPQKQVVDGTNLLQEVAQSLSEFAAQKRVQIICPLPHRPVSFQADPHQLHTALVCLLRNAIESAPPDGWASVRLETPAPDRLEWVIEDNGQGPAPAQRDHMFDPFYSGRQAGRGRGLGLPTAWRLAREHGGEVRFEDLPEGPTRFVLSLPREPGMNGNGTGHGLPGRLPVSDEAVTS